MNEQNHRTFVITPARTGSSLLCAVIADAGADFGMDSVADWDPAVGQYEHPRLVEAQFRLRKSYALSPDKPSKLLDRLQWDLLRHKAKTDLKAALRQAKFFKANDLDLSVQLSFKLGYFPTVILNTRSFEHCATSMFIRRSYSDVNELADKYNRILKNGLLLMNIFGGCIVDYADFTNTDETQWAGTVSKVTGLELGALIKARDTRLKPGLAKDVTHHPVLNPEGDALYAHIKSLRRQVFEPSRAALRAWEGRS